MPTYEYSCKNCGETVEVFQSFSDKPLRTHASCGGDLQKVFHARGVVFKGSGFYRTDSRSGGGSGNGSSGTKAEKDSSKKADKAEKTSAVSSSTD